MSQYHKLIDGEWIRPKRKGFREQCCDCAKVHDVDYRIVKSKTGNRHFVEFKAVSNTRATRRARARYHDET